MLHMKNRTLFKLQQPNCPWAFFNLLFPPTSPLQGYREAGVCLSAHSPLIKAAIKTNAKAYLLALNIL